MQGAYCTHTTCPLGCKTKYLPLLSQYMIFFSHEYPWTLSIQPKGQKAFLGKFLENPGLLKVLKAFNRQIQKEKFGYALQGCPLFWKF